MHPFPSVLVHRYTHLAFTAVQTLGECFLCAALRWKEPEVIFRLEFWFSPTTVAQASSKPYSISFYLHFELVSWKKGRAMFSFSSVCHPFKDEEIFNSFTANYSRGFLKPSPTVSSLMSSLLQRMKHLVRFISDGMIGSSTKLHSYLKQKFRVLCEVKKLFGET
jgi:hypothetical protein